MWIIAQVLNQINMLLAVAKLHKRHWTKRKWKSHAFFICNLAAPWPALGHYRGDSHTHPMLITAFCQFVTKRSPEASYPGWVPKPSRGSSGVWTINLPICSQSLKALGHCALMFDIRTDAREICLFDTNKNILSFCFLLKNIFKLSFWFCLWDDGVLYKYEWLWNSIPFLTVFDT